MRARKQKRTVRRSKSGRVASPGGDSRLSAHIGLVLLLIVAVFALYGGSLQNPLVFDDGFFQEPVLKEYGHSWFQFKIRWFAYVTFGWTYNLFGLSWPWYRAGNVLLHAMTAVTLFAFLLRLFDAVLKPAPAAGVAQNMSTAQMAFFGVMIFALHPVSVYGVAYLVERPIIMATLFSVASLLMYLEGLLRSGSKWFLWSALFYFLAVFSKEHCVLLPGVALALTLLLRKPSALLIRELWLPYALFLLIGVTIVLKAKGVLGTPYEPFAAQAVASLSESGAQLPHLSDQVSATQSALNLAASANVQLPSPEIAAVKDRTAASASGVYLSSVISESWLFFKYLVLWFLPNPGWMSVDLRQKFATGLLSWPETAGFALFILYPFAALALLLKGGRRGLLGFGMLFPWTLFLTEVSTVRIQEPFVLYRAYLWTSGLTVLMPLCVLRGRMWRNIALCSGICILLFMASLNRLDTFSSVWKLWDDVVAKNTDRSLIFVERGYNNRGMSSMEIGNYSDALRDFNTALALNAKDADLYVNRGTLYLKTSSHELALDDLNTAIKLNDRSAEAFSQRCVLYIRLSQLDQALPDCDRALALDAWHQIARLNRGIIYATNSRYAEALAEFDAAVETNAKNPVAHFNRGRILLSLFRDSEGNASLKKSCELGFAPACGALKGPR